MEPGIGTAPVMSMENATRTAPDQAYAGDDPETYGALLQLMKEIDVLRSENDALCREINRRDAELAWITRQLTSLGAGGRADQDARLGDADRDASRRTVVWRHLLRKLKHAVRRAWRDA